MIRLDVLELTNKQLDALEEDEDGYLMAECTIIERYFMTIDNFGEYIDYDGTMYTRFYSGGMEWISPLEVEDFKQMIIDYGKAYGH